MRAPILSSLIAVCLVNPQPGISPASVKTIPVVSTSRLPLVVYLRNETYNSDMTIMATKVVFVKNGKIRVNNGAVIRIQADEIEVQSAYTIDATGNKGVDANAPADWCAHNCECGWKYQGQSDYDKAGHPIYDKGNRGGDGGPGGTVIVSYCTLSGIEGGLGNLHVLTNGGLGGRGSRGRKLINPCKRLPSGELEHKFGSYGDNGATGTDGIWRYNKVCN